MDCIVNSVLVCVSKVKNNCSKILDALKTHMNDGNLKSGHISNLLNSGPKSTNLHWKYVTKFTNYTHKSRKWMVELTVFILSSWRLNRQNSHWEVKSSIHLSKMVCWVRTPSERTHISKYVSCNGSWKHSKLSEISRCLCRGCVFSLECYFLLFCRLVCLILYCMLDL